VIVFLDRPSTVNTYRHDRCLGHETLWWTTNLPSTATIHLSSSSRCLRPYHLQERFPTISNFSTKPTSLRSHYTPSLVRNLIHDIGIESVLGGTRSQPTESSPTRRGKWESAPRISEPREFRGIHGVIFQVFWNRSLIAQSLLILYRSVACYPTRH